VWIIIVENGNVLGSVAEEALMHLATDVLVAHLKLLPSWVAV
jgi:hypothetical protein